MNIHASIRQLTQGSSILRELIAHDELKITGVEYSLETGQVEFFEPQ